MKKTMCDCGHLATPTTVSPGYGRTADGKTICFACCAENDKKQLLETGKLSGYISKNDAGQWRFTNWPGSLSIPVHSFRFSWHNFAGKNGRMDFWFRFEGANYHGVQIGNNNQIARVKRLK